jgi:hypothetical protein
VEPLRTTDAANVNWIHDSANALVVRGEVLSAVGDTDGAARALDAAERNAALLTSRDGSVTKWRLLDVRERLARGTIQLALGEPARARDTAKAAIAVIARLSADQRQLGEAQYLRARGLSQMGAALAKSGDAAGARAVWRDVARAPVGDGAREEPRLMALRAGALAALGDSKGEAVLLARLRRLGWPEVKGGEIDSRVH